MNDPIYATSLDVLLSHPEVRAAVEDASEDGVETFSAEYAEDRRLAFLFLSERIGVTLFVLDRDGETSASLGQVWVPEELIPLLRQAIEAHELRSRAARSQPTLHVQFRVQPGLNGRS